MNRHGHHTTVHRTSPASRRGAVLLVVLVIVALAVIVGGAVLEASRVEAASNAAALRSTQARALAWSGVQGLMAELASQRDAILRGDEPRITTEWTLFGEDGPVRGIVRLLPLDTPGMRTIESESAKLDVNTATADMLAKVPGLDPEIASRIEQARQRRRFGSLDELATIDGITLDMLFGGGGRDTDFGGSHERGSASRAPGAELSDAGLASWLTVFSFDPNIQAGIGQEGDSSRGDLRVNLAAGWSDDLQAGVTKRFGADVANGVRGIMQQGTTFKRDGDIVAALRRFNVQPNEWTGILDCFTTVADPYRLGRLDLNLASEEVLACVPGLDEASAAAIVATRDRLDTQTRLDVAWPVIQNIVTPAAFEQAVDHLTTQSAQWRARLETGILDASRGWEVAPGEEVLRDRMVMEVVIDIASQRPRVAYLRDVTMLEVAAAVTEFRRANAAEDTDPLDLPMPEPPEEPETPEPDRPIVRQPTAREPSRSSSVAPPAEREAEPAENPAETAVPPAGQDRRHGRWTSQGGRR